MSIDAVASIGLADAGVIQPVSGVRAVGGRGTLLVRPVSSSRSAGPTIWASEPARRVAEPERARTQEAVRGTAHQRNADGDSATFSSRLGELTEAEHAELDKLKKRDQEVRTHEHAHIAAGGGLVRGGASYQTQTGPDGSEYAVGGHVRIDTSPASTHEETIAKAQRIRQAALAPGEPSGQDLAVAARASRMEASARAAISRERGHNGPESVEPGATVRRSSPISPSQQASASGARLDLFA